MHYIKFRGLSVIFNFGGLSIILNFRGLSTLLQDWRIVQYIVLAESDQYNMILYQRVVQYIIISEYGGLSTLLQDRSMSNGFSKTKSFCF